MSRAVELVEALEQLECPGPKRSREYLAEVEAHKARRELAAKWLGRQIVRHQMRLELGE